MPTWIDKRIELLIAGVMVNLSRTRLHNDVFQECAATDYMVRTKAVGRDVGIVYVLSFRPGRTRSAPHRDLTEEEDTNKTADYRLYWPCPILELRRRLLMVGA